MREVQGSGLTSCFPFLFSFDQCIVSDVEHTVALKAETLGTTNYNLWLEMNKTESLPCVPNMKQVHAIEMMQL